MDRRDFYNVGIMEPRVSTKHWMILAKLKGGGVRRNNRYFKERSIWTIVSQKRVPMQEGDTNFNDRKKEAKNPTRTAREKATWIIDYTWILVYQRTDLRQGHTSVQKDLQAVMMRF